MALRAEKNRGETRRGKMDGWMDGGIPQDGGEASGKSMGYRPAARGCLEEGEVLYCDSFQTGKVNGV